MLQSRESLGEWLSRLTLDQDMVRTDLLEPAIAWELPQLHTAWLRSTPDTRRRVALKSPDHPQARPWLTTLFDEAWEANRHREAALWAWLIHQHHAADEPRTLRVVEHWALEDSDPFDRHGFQVSNKTLTGGAGALVEMMDSWITHTQWSGRDEVVRRLYDARVTKWPRYHTSWYRTPTDAEQEARRLPWLSFGYHDGIGGLHVAGHIQSWVRAIDATDLRDSALSWDESEFGSTELWALEWWLADADAAHLWNKLEQLLAGMDGEGQDVLDARLGRIGALLRELGDRDPQRLVDWTLLRCSSVFRSIDLPDNPDWFWALDHEEAGLDALVEFVALHRPAAVGDIWRDWWSIATTVGRRRWVLRHLAWRATWSGADAARAGALLRQWALER